MNVQDLVSLVNKIMKETDEHKQTVLQVIVGGGLSPEEYAKQCGYLHGVTWAIQNMRNAVIDFAKKLEGTKDDDQ